MDLQDEYKKTLKNLRQAWCNFDQAQPNHIDTAIAQINQVEIRMGSILKELKKT